MADDTRQTKEDLSREALTLDPTAKSFTATQWQGGKQIPYKPPENANMMAGGTQHTAGGQVPDVTWQNALTLEGYPITELHKRPCMRDAGMTGIGAGAATGALRGIFGASMAKSCNWAVGTFMIASIVQYNYCLYRRQAEKEGMMRAVEILNKKEMEKKAREARKEKMREERRAAKDAEQDEQLRLLREKDAGGKPWWKVW